MNIITYMGGISFLVIFARLFPALDKSVAICLGLFLALFAALRVGGFDYDAHISMVEFIRSFEGSSLVDAATIAKDPLFGIIVYSIGLLSDDPVWVIYTLVAISVTLKVLFSFSLNRNSTLFMGLYAVFLAPGLEFAALRAAAGLGFLVWATQFYMPKIRRAGWLFLSSLSHISMIPGSLLIVFTKKFTGLKMLVAFALIALGTYGIIYITSLEFTGRTAAYIDNRGTVLAFLPSLATLALLLFSFDPSRLKETEEHHPSSRTLFNVSLGLIAVALGSTSQVVTTSTRFLEIAWFLMLILFVQGTSTQRKFGFWIGFIVFLSFLAEINIYRNTWAAFSEMGLLDTW